MRQITKSTIVIPGPGLWTLLFGIVILCFLAYGYFLASSVVYAAATKQIAREIIATDRSLATLEGRYLGTLNQLSRNAAKRHGYEDIAQVHYVHFGADKLSFAP